MGSNFKAIGYIIFCCVAVELLLRFSSVLQTYNEDLGGGYFSYYGMTLDSWYWTREPSEPYVMDQPEFTYTFQANSQGFRDEEWSREKPDSVRRLFVVGDSFVEGDGVPYGEAVTDHLQVLLDSASSGSDCRWEVCNAGACGSDVFYARMLVEHLLGQFDHDAILVVINDSDLDDYLFRGGMERFHPDTSARFRDGPWWQPFFRFSHIIRALVRLTGVDGDRLVREGERERVHLVSLPPMVQVLKDVQKLCDERKVDLMVITQPFPWQVFEMAKESDSLKRHWLVDIGMKSFGPQRYFHSTFAKLPAMLEEAGIPSVDVAVNMAQQLGHRPLESFGWPVNGHFNALGYRAMARAIYEEVSKRDLDFFCAASTDVPDYVDTPTSDLEEL